MFRYNLPPALLAEWLGSFTCHCSNTGVEQTLNTSQRTKLTLQKKILPPLLPGFKLTTFPSQVWCSYQQAIPVPWWTGGCFANEFLLLQLVVVSTWMLISLRFDILSSRRLMLMILLKLMMINPRLMLMILLRLMMINPRLPCPADCTGLACRRLLVQCMEYRLVCPCLTSTSQGAQTVGSVTRAHWWQTV